MDKRYSKIIWTLKNNNKLFTIKWRILGSADLITTLTRNVVYAFLKNLESSVRSICVVSPNPVSFIKAKQQTNKINKSKLACARYTKVLSNIRSEKQREGRLAVSTGLCFTKIGQGTYLLSCYCFTGGEVVFAQTSGERQENFVRKHCR